MSESTSCPVPFSGYERVVLAHGGGGRVMHSLIEGLFARILGREHLEIEHDGAVVDLAGPVVVTTDAFTVSPLFFPGGDIGRLAVCGTVNDLAMCGAVPRYLSAAFILEEGLRLEELEQIVQSMAAAAREAGVAFVTGDTKVVEKGKGDGTFITTTGLGTRRTPRSIGPNRIQVGDVIIVSGPVGDHGMAILSVREGIAHQTPIVSDVAPVAQAVLSLVDAGVDLHCLRDPTRGGLASALCELSRSSSLSMRIREDAIPVRGAVKDACELLGLDPLHMACEGQFVAVVARSDAERALATLRSRACPRASMVGEVTDADRALVVLENAIGSARILDMLAGEPLPRIC